MIFIPLVGTPETDPLAVKLFNNRLCMLTLQSSKSRIVYLLIFKVKLDNYGYNVLLASQGVYLTEAR